MKNKLLEILADVCDEEEILKNIQYDLFENEALDSLAFVSLLNEVEDNFGITIQPTQVERESFRTPENILNMLEKFQ